MAPSTTLPAEASLPRHVPLASATRGGIVEAVHYGSIAVVNRDGKLLRHCGDPHAIVFPRSSLKPFQAMPLVAHPDVHRFGFTPREIALICASHSGEPRHAEAVAAMLKKIDCEKRHLQCGVHPPLYFEAMEIKPHAEDVFTVLHHNCSGKHTGMLALSRLLNAPIDSYVELSHPVQQKIHDAVAYFAAIPKEQIVVGIDGCSVPNFAIPLTALARAYARLSSEQADERYGDAPRTIFAAMSAHPEMVSGLKRIDLALMHVGHGDWVAKSGAEAIHALAIRSQGVGIAIKIADGAARAVHVVIVEVLRQLGLINDISNSPLQTYARPKLTNWRGIETGEVLPVFQLK